MSQQNDFFCDCLVFQLYIVRSFNGTWYLFRLNLKRYSSSKVYKISGLWYVVRGSLWWFQWKIPEAECRTPRCAQKMTSWWGLDGTPVPQADLSLCPHPADKGLVFCHALMCFHTLSDGLSSMFWNYHTHIIPE